MRDTGKEKVFEAYTFFEVGMFLCAMAVYFFLFAILLLFGEVRTPWMQRVVLKVRA